VVRELQRHLMARRNGEDAGLDGGDFHHAIIATKFLGRGAVLL
jgi:hypothetical protein